MSVGVAILVGGQSRRMGRPKALLPLDGNTLLERTVHLARQVSPCVALVGSPPFELPPAVRSLPLLPDAKPDAGPLGGLAAALAEWNNDACILLACDLPRLDAVLLRRLLAFADDPGCDAAVPVTAELDRRAPDREHGVAGRRQMHPCCALYRATARPAIDFALAQGRYALLPILAELRVREIPLPSDECHFVANWNTADDLRPNPLD